MLPPNADTGYLDSLTLTGRSKRPDFNTKPSVFVESAAVQPSCSDLADEESRFLATLPEPLARHVDALHQRLRASNKRMSSLEAQLAELRKACRVAGIFSASSPKFPKSEPPLPQTESGTAGLSDVKDREATKIPGVSCSHEGRDFCVFVLDVPAGQRSRQSAEGVATSTSGGPGPLQQIP